MFEKMDGSSDVRTKVYRYLKIRMRNGLNSDTLPLVRSFLISELL